MSEEEAAAPAGSGLASALRSALVARARSFGALGIGLVAALVVEVAFFASQSEFFLTQPNITNIGRAMAIVGIVAAGETIVMISGGFDLSVGSTMAAAGMVFAYGLDQGWPLLAGAALGLLLGGVIGVANGAIVSYARINPLIATLATLGIVRGLGFVVSDGEEIIIHDKDFLDLGTAEIASVPVIVLIMLAAFVVLGLIVPRTRYGRYVYAIGSSARASRLAGVPIHRYRIAFYVTCGVLAALGGMVAVARVGSAQPTANLGAELDVITAVILGGTSLNGGRGRLFGTFLGLLLIAVLNNGLILMDVQSYWQQVVKGCVLLLAVFWDEIRRTRRDEY